MGIKSREIQFDPANTNILGCNGSGKTTINTAFRWLLFNKDVKDRKDFEVKTIDSSGNVKHGLEHKVSATLEASGKELILTKIYKEIWRKKKGEEEKVFSGHETLYYIDEVPCLKKEYDEFLDDLLPENTFKIITDPLYFSTQLHWTEQRQVLLEVTGDIAEDQVIAANSILEKLDLEGKNIEQYRKMVREKKKKLNQELERIPVRIDEVEKGKREEDFDAINIEMLECQRELEEIDNFLSSDAAKSPNRDKLNNKLEKVYREIQDKEGAYRTEFLRETNELKNKLITFRDESEQARVKINRLKIRAQRINEENQRHEQVLIDLRKDWTKKDEEEFKADIDAVCPVCEQEIPEEKLKSKLEELKKNFNSEKAEVLTFISNKGKEISKQKEENLNRLKEINEEINKYEEISTETTNEAEALAEKVKQLEFEDPEDLIELKRQKKDIENELLMQLNADQERLTSKAIERKETLAKEIDQLKSVLLYKETNKKADARIEELKKKQKETARKIAEIEKQEYLSEEFIKTKVSLLEERINEKFKYVSFRLFETQVDGGINEVCKALVNGVPFTDANRAGQINAGIDIINTLTEHYKVYAPIFIDNRESITDVIETNSQIINLVVDPSVKELTVLNEGQQEEEKKIRGEYSRERK